jgi:hypothetical protein
MAKPKKKTSPKDSKLAKKFKSESVRLYKRVKKIIPIGLGISSLDFAHMHRPKNAMSEFRIEDSKGNFIDFTLTPPAKWACHTNFVRLNNRGKMVDQLWKGTETPLKKLKKKFFKDIIKEFEKFISKPKKKKRK